MLFETLREPPPVGSLREFVLTLYVLQRDRIEHARFRALAQTLVDKEKGIEAFDEYRNTHFPWLEAAKRRDKEEHVRVLMNEIKRGVIGIKPLMDKPMKSRLRGARPAPPATPGSSRRGEELYRKLGMVIPIK